MTSEQTQNEEIFSTRDLTLAAVLITLKFPMTGLDFQIEGVKSQPVGYFIFENSAALRSARQKFSQSMLSVEPKLLVTNIHSLKAEVVNAFKNPHNRTF